MKLSNGSPTKILGLQVGEIALDLIRSNAPTLRVRFALLAEIEGADGAPGPVSFMDVGDLNQWSPKTIEAMRVFTEALEEDALKLIFKAPAQGTETTRAEGCDEPAQF